MSMILLGENNHRLSVYMQHALERFGHDVRVATDGDAALWDALEHLPDLILLDVDLPGRDSLDLEQEFKRIPWTRRTPVLFLVDPTTVPPELQFRSTVCLRKPVQAAQLLESVDTTLKQAAQAQPHHASGPR
jgi:DNA-binding response OmpR family regulator